MCHLKNSKGNKSKQTELKQVQFWNDKNTIKTLHSRLSNKKIFLEFNMLFQILEKNSLFINSTHKRYLNIALYFELLKQSSNISTQIIS